MDFKEKFEIIVANKIAMMKIQRLQMIQRFVVEEFSEEKAAEIIEKAEILIKETVAALEQFDFDNIENIENKIVELEKEVF